MTRTLIAFVWLAWLAGSASAQAPATLRLDATQAAVGEDNLRAAIETELGVSVASGNAGADARYLITVRSTDADSAEVSFTDSEGRSITRSVDLTGTAEEAFEVLALLAANLVHNEAAGLLPTLEATAAAPAAEVPPAAPSTPALKPDVVVESVATPTPQPQRPSPCSVAPTSWFGADVFPFVGSSSTAAGRQAVRRLSFNLAGGLARGVHGFELSGGVGIAREAVCGLRIAGGANVATGDVSGVSIASVNLTLGETRGVSIAPLNVLAAATGSTIGAVNVARGELRGLNVGVVNASRSTRGLTVGVLNVASQDADGLTLGVVNVSRRATASLGLVNVIFDGRTSLDVWGTETGTVLVGLTHGGKVLHNLYGVGEQIAGKDRLVVALGLGARLYTHPRVRVDLDTLAIQHDPIEGDAKLSLIGTLRLPITVRLYERFGAFAAPSYSALISRDPGEPTVTPFGSRVIEDGKRTRITDFPGLTLGLRVDLGKQR